MGSNLQQIGVGHGHDPHVCAGCARSGERHHGGVDVHGLPHLDARGAFLGAPAIRSAACPRAGRRARTTIPRGARVHDAAHDGVLRRDADAVHAVREPGRHDAREHDAVRVRAAVRPVYAVRSCRWGHHYAEGRDEEGAGLDEGVYVSEGRES